MPHSTTLGNCLNGARYEFFYFKSETTTWGIQFKNWEWNVGFRLSLGLETKILLVAALSLFSIEFLSLSQPQQQRGEGLFHKLPTC